MNTEPESFDELRRLMAVKRHEEPPPAYFQNLSGKIVSRIERGEGQLTLWERLSSNFTLRPAFALRLCRGCFWRVHGQRDLFRQNGQPGSLRPGGTGDGLGSRHPNRGFCQPDGTIAPAAARGQLAGQHQSRRPAASPAVLVRPARPRHPGLLHAGQLSLMINQKSTKNT